MAPEIVRPPPPTRAATTNSTTTTTATAAATTLTAATLTATTADLKITKGYPDHAFEPLHECVRIDSEKRVNNCTASGVFRENTTA